MIGEVRLDEAAQAVVVETPLKLWPIQNAATIFVTFEVVSSSETTLGFRAESDDGAGILASANRAIETLIVKVRARAPAGVSPAGEAPDGGDPFSFLRENDGESSDAAAPAGVLVRVCWPGMWMLIDAKVIVSLNGTSFTGSFVKGFETNFKVLPGSYALSAKLSVRSAQTYRLDLGDPGVYRVQLDYSTAWGTFANTCDVTRIAAAPRGDPTPFSPSAPAPNSVKPPPVTAPLGGGCPPPKPASHGVKPAVARWHASAGGVDVGPLTDADLRKLAASGDLSPGDIVWREGLKEWVPANRVRGLFPGAGDK